MSFVPATQSDHHWTTQQIETIKKTICKGASEEDFQMFLYACKRSGLDPFMKQIYSVPRGNQRTIQVSIDGFRAIADRTGKYCPGKESSYTYDAKGNLESATAYVKKLTPDGTWHHFGATAHMKEYDGGGNMWKKFPHAMLSKCAESQVLRKAFPSALSGLYSSEEMQQAEKHETTSAEEVEVETVNKEEVIGYYKAEELLDLIGDDLEYKERILAGYRKSHGITELEKIPLKHWGQLQAAVRSHAAERVEQEMETVVTKGTKATKGQLDDEPVSVFGFGTERE